MRRRFSRGWLLTVLLLVMAASATVPELTAQEQGRKAIRKVTPVYPELARRSNISGVVKIEATITPSGNVRATKVVGGNPLLVNAALTALSKWKFEAASGETSQLIVFNFDR